MKDFTDEQLITLATVWDYATEQLIKNGFDDMDDIAQGGVKFGEEIAAEFMRRGIY